MARALPSILAGALSKSMLPKRKRPSLPRLAPSIKENNLQVDSPEVSTEISTAPRFQEELGTGQFSGSRRLVCSQSFTLLLLRRLTVRQSASFETAMVAFLERLSKTIIMEQPEYYFGLQRTVYSRSGRCLMVEAAVSLTEASS